MAGNELSEKIGQLTKPDPQQQIADLLAQLIRDEERHHQQVMTALNQIVQISIAHASTTAEQEAVQTKILQRMEQRGPHL